MLNKDVYDRFLAGDKYETIAAQLEMNVGTVCRRIRDHESVLDILGLPVPKRRKSELRLQQ